MNDQESKPVNLAELEVSTCLSEIDEMESADKKLHYLIEVMKAKVSYQKNFHFKSFWELKSKALDLFKERIEMRSTLWKEYRELAEEVHHLKEVIDEKVTFDLEQLSLAIESLENELKEEKKVDVTLEVDFKNISLKKTDYLSSFSEVKKLTSFALKVQSLREELIKTHLPLRKKHKLFDRLNAIADNVFPKRKELSVSLSKQFEKDVSSFIDKYFNEEAKVPYLKLKDQIKNFQALGKALPLTSQTFSKTRSSLSECWEKMKELEGSYKKEKNEKQEKSILEAQKVEAQIKELQLEIEKMDQKQVKDKLSQIESFMKSLSLEKRELNALNSDIKSIKNDLKERQKKEEQKVLDALKTEINELKELDETHAVLQSTKEELVKKIGDSSFSEEEKMQLALLLDPIEDKILEKKLLVTAEEDLELLEGVESVIHQLESDQKKLKSEVSQYKKMLSSSNLSMDRVLTLTEMSDNTKARLEKVTSHLKDLKSKAKQLSNG